jgi:phenylalanyl-tRNA synthetase beta chain
MLELGQPLHAFDYDVLKKRAGGKPVKIVTRTAKAGEMITTLDGNERKLDPATILVCDEVGALSIAGVMGGLESEVSERTRNILLEGAVWNMINIRKTSRAQNLPSEASFRYTRGVHPAMAERGVKRGLELMASWSGGKVNPLMVDNYPAPPAPAVVAITPHDVKRSLGIELGAAKIAEFLNLLEFKTEVHGENVKAISPDHRLDIGEGDTGKADLIEEIARIYGYDNIPETRISDLLPIQRGNARLANMERTRDLLAALGLQEVISYRWTTPEREARRLPPGAAADDRPYMRIANPLAYEKAFLRHSVLSSLLDIAERNSRHHAHMALFEMGPVFLHSENASGLPDEPYRLTLLLAGQRSLPGWQPADTGAMDFYDLKGVISDLLTGLDLDQIRYTPGKHPSFHPGKCALVYVGEQQLGVFGELHPKVCDAYSWADTFKYPILAADLDMELLIKLIPTLSNTADVPSFPAVVEDLALVLDEAAPADKVAELIQQTGGKLLTEVRLFDVFRSEQLGAGKKSLAYRLTYQAMDRTLTDGEVSQLRHKIIKRLEYELKAKLRS